MRRNLTVAAALIGALFEASPALASVESHAAPNGRIHFAASINWSGYAVGGPGPYTSVSSSWTQPAVDCAATPTGFSSFWIGLDGDTTRTVEQTGTEADCVNGTPHYSAWYEMFPKRLARYPTSVSPGDSITGSVAYAGHGRFQLTLSDTTQGWSQTTSQRRRSAKRGSAEVIAEAPTSRRTVLPMADFGTVVFSDASVNGSLLTGSTPGVEPLTMTSGMFVTATPSAISSGSFSDTWHRG